MRFECLDDWLAWQESLNPKEIDLGLDRVAQVLTRAGLSSSFSCPLITVAGTNGKGSVVATLEAIAMASGLKVCSYTSPHIFRYNERIKIDAQPVDDSVLCAAFERIDQARGDHVCGNTALTYFEFGTLAAIDLFFRQQPDLVILEVGLGGRLDAVNIMDADVSVLTSVAIDHVDWLGEDRESIGFEKAGIFRPRNTVVCGDIDPPQSVFTEAEKKYCEFLLAGRDYEVIPGENWTLKSAYGDMANLPEPNLTGEFQKFNAAAAIVALQVLQAKTLLNTEIELSDAVVSAMSKIELAGRFQKLKDRPQVFVDVAHNPQAALALSSQLKSIAPVEGQTWAIVAMLADKDITGVFENVRADIDNWCFAGLEKVTRGMSVQAFLQTLPADFLGKTMSVLTEENRHDLALNQCTMLSETVLLARGVEKACDIVLSKADDNDRIIIFGSFHTVAESMQYFSMNNDTAELKN